MTRVHAGLLPDVVGPARQALTIMAAKLPHAPTRAVENQQVKILAQASRDATRTRHQADTVVFDSPSIGPTGRADPGDSVLSLVLNAAWQQDCDDEVNAGDAYVARMVAVAWLNGQPTTLQELPGHEDRKRAESAYQALVSLPQAEQKRRMAQAHDATLDCRTDALVSILPKETP
jgi:hypothetical protein